MNKSVLAALTVAASLCFGNPAYATGTPGGCTPGYWKNHFDTWVTLSPYYSIYDVVTFPPELYVGFTNVSMLDALELPGGPGLDGAARILVRHTMAALLNVRQPEVNFPLEKDQVMTMTNDALASLNREQMLSVATFLMTQNELGCPLN